MTRRFAISTFLFIISLVSACDRKEPIPSQTASTNSAQHAESDGWLRGSVDDRFALVSKHLRGFDMAMVEVGYRYTELYWAGRDRKVEAVNGRWTDRRSPRHRAIPTASRGVPGGHASDTLIPR